MQCPRCGQDSPLRSRFCEECGTPLGRPCAHCSALLSAGARFCPECGNAAAVDPAGFAPSRFSSPAGYTPPHLAEKMLTSRAALEGERKQVTILFADLADSMEQISRSDPEEAQALLDPVLERMIGAVHVYEGTVNQVMGDGIMALFGAPVAHEDHAVRACYAALRMQETLEAFARDLESRRGIRVQVRVGLNSGEVVVRALGGDLRMDYSAVGRTTHLAARMEQMAAPGTILAARATRDLVAGHVRLKAVGRRPVRGLHEPIELFEVVGAEAPRSRFHAQSLTGLSRFVGRTDELARLEGLLNQARRGSGRVVALSAEAGMGKSRLYWEFLHSPLAKGCRVLETDCVAHLRATPYRPAVDLLRACLAIDDTDGAESIRRKIAATLGEDAGSSATTAPLLWLLDVPVDDAQWNGIEAHQRRQWVVDAFKGVIARASRSEPLIVLIEDVHWADPDTRALLDDLVDGVATLQVLLLLSFRQEHRHHWGHRSHYHELHLDPLSSVSAAELLEDLLGGDPALDSLKRLLVSRTDGNPFFLEEMTRNLRETGVLTGPRGACRLARAVHSVHVPPTVQPIIAARVDALPDAAKRLLQSAAVVGPDVPLALLQQVSGDISEAVLRSDVALLREGEFLYESQLYPDLVYSFRHAITHDVVYDGVLSDRRRGLHAMLVGAMERLYAGRLADHVERLAHHALRGEQWDKAVGYLRQAAGRARERAANREAVAWLTQAQAALAHLPETPENLGLAVDLRFDLRGSLYPLGEFELIASTLREAEKLGAALGDERRLAWVAFHLGECLRLAGRLTEAREQLERARGAAVIVGDPALRVAANQYLSLTRHALGDYAGAAADMRTVLSLPLERPEVAEFSHTQAGSSAGFRAVSTCWLARCLAETGEFEAAIDAGREALRAAENLPHPYPLATTRWALGSVYALRGDLAAADVLLSAALAGSEAAGLTVTLPQVMRMVGWVRAMAGRPAEGLQFLQQALAAAKSMGIEVAFAAIWSQLGEAHLLNGERDEAARVARLALERAQAAGQRGDEARALHLMGAIAAAGAGTAPRRRCASTRTRSRSPRRGRCAPSRRAVTSTSPGSSGRPATTTGLVPISPPPARCSR